MNRQRIRGCGKAKYLISHTNLVHMAFSPTWGWGAPPPGKGKAMGTRLERKNSSARAFLTLYISHLVVFRKTTTWNHKESGRSTGGARPGAYHVRINRFFQNQQTSRTRWCLPFAIVLGWWDWKLENLANGKEIFLWLPLELVYNFPYYLLSFLVSSLSSAENNCGKLNCKW